MKSFKKWIINKLFNRYFKYFNYPFSTANSYINSLPQNKRHKYYREVSEWIKSEAFRVEHQSLMKLAYKELATEDTDSYSREAYRLLLIFLVKYEQRLNHLNEVYQSDKIINDQQSKLNK